MNIPDPTHIEDLIRKQLPDATVVVQDHGGSHFSARVVSAAFAGKSKVQQHQMVYKALGGLMDRDLHALALQTEAP